MIHILFLVLTLTFGICISSPASENIPSQHELDLLSLINVARENPLAMASSFGMDPDQLLNDLPELNLILTQGLPPLSFNEYLYNAATQHTLDMIANNYFSHDSLDGSTYSDRIIQSGYQAVSTGESLCMLGFNNLIASEDAVKIMFEKMFIDELDPMRTEKLNILDTDVAEAGVSICSGTYVQNGFFFNVYLVTCDFADDVINTGAVETAFLEMINRARKDPLAVLDDIGIDEATARATLGDDAWILDQGLPPLASNEKLHEAALARSLDLDEWFCGKNIPDKGEGLAERIVSAGYNAICAGEALGGLFSETFVVPLIFACSIFEAMVLEEFSLPQGERKIFSPFMTEAGISFRTQTINCGDCEDPVTGYAVVADLAGPSVIRRFLVGNVYHDCNADGNVDPGEGVVGIRVSLRNLLSPSPVEEAGGYPGVEDIVTYTGPRGSYQLEIPILNCHEAFVAWDGGVLLARYPVPLNISENQLKDFVIRGQSN
jgi:hypothetical protein